MNKLQHFPPGSEEHIEHPSQARIGIHPYPDKLYVVTMLENPIRHRSRYKNYWAFEKHVTDSGGILYTVEVALENRKFEVTEAGNPRHIQLRTKCEMWHKEDAQNLGTTRLPEEAQKIAFIDADVKFMRDDWVQETLHQLAHYDVVQMFSEVYNLGPDDTPLTNRRSFMWNYIENRPAPHDPEFINLKRGNNNPGYSGGGGVGTWNHTGFGWAWRKPALDTAGGLIWWAAAGSGDYHMATALVGDVYASLNPHFPPRYIELCEQWQEKVKPIRNNPNGGVGYVKGGIMHMFHGTTKNRGYKDRWRLLKHANYNPDIDMTRDSQGLLQLSGHNVALRDGLRAYNRMRDEDSTNTDGML